MTKKSKRVALPMTPDTPTSRSQHDWRPIAEALRADRGTWYKLDDGLPKLNTWWVRRGVPKAFAPPGSFDAVINAKGAWLVYLGEPVEPWDCYGGNGQLDARAFGELERGDA